MNNILRVFLVTTSLIPQSLFAGTEEFKEELKNIRANFSPKIQQLESQNRGAIFDLTKDLSLHYKRLASKICAEVMERHPGIQDLVSVALSGSVAWGEPTLTSDIEVVYLVPNYNNMKQVFDFTLDFADEFEKIGDKHFTLDQVSTHELEEDKMAILERAPAIFTIEDIEKFNLTILSPFDHEKVREYVGHFNQLLPGANLTSHRILQEVAPKLSDRINFSHSLFNLEFLGGKAELFEEYEVHFQSVAAKMIKDFVDGRLEARKAAEQQMLSYGSSWTTYIGALPDDSMRIRERFINFLNNTYSEESFQDEYIKLSWRCVTNVIRGLGFSLGATHEKGTLDTLNALKSTPLKGTIGTWTAALSEKSYEDLLHKGATLTWARLKDSLGEEIFSEHEEITAKIKGLCNLTEIASIGHSYAQSYNNFLYGLSDSI